MTFEEILIEHGVERAPEGHTHSRQNWLQIDCPFCSKGAQHYRMGYNLSTGHVHCWLCGYHNLTETLAELIGVNYHQAKILLKDIRVDYVAPIRHAGTLTLPKGIKPLSECPQHKRYLIERGYDWRKLVRLWQLQGVGLSPRLSWRVFIPIHLNGAVVSWTTRTISTDKSVLRYISASLEEESVSHKTLLYGEDYARHAIVICEGPADVWAIGPGAVAICGTGFKQAQILRMSKYPVRAVCLDSEIEAQRRAKKLVDALRDFPGETFNVELQTGKDAGCATKKELRQLRRAVLK